MAKKKVRCGVREATHVNVGDREERIVDTWGISPEGNFAKPSEGGFGVVTEGGRVVSMYQAKFYTREMDDKTDE